MIIKIAVIGFFAYGSNHNGGQENKTRALADLLKDKYGGKNVCTVDTLGWKKRPMKLMLNVRKAMRDVDVVIMLPSRNGVKVFSKLLLMFRKKNCMLFYSVIGGWLPTLTKTKSGLRKRLAKFDGIWVETETMKKELSKQGLLEVRVVPNFKRIQPVSKKELSRNFVEPYRICTFSRVLKEKGIEDAIRAVMKVNKDFGREVYKLDIYGKIEVDYEESFREIMNKVPKCIEYIGVVPYESTVDVLKDYFFLLFPTKRYHDEGVPGTIIDAYAAGLPIVAAKWRNYDNVVADGVTGIGYRMGDNEELEKKLKMIVENPSLITDKREKCLDAFNNYSEEHVFNIIKEELRR